MEWQAIKFMKAQGYNSSEIGLQQFGPTLFDFPDKKELDISYFKKGFGGFLAPFFIGEKYYDRDYFLAEYNDRLKKYTESIGRK
jgi:hypothetical protein